MSAAAHSGEQKARISVNGVGITQAQIDAEVQHHPAPDFFSAQEAAARALVVRELLLQQAEKLGLYERNVTSPEKAIEELLAREVITPEPDDEICRRYFENNRKKFVTTPLYEASHILFLAPPEEVEARRQAFEKAEKAIAHLRAHPEDFAKFAESHSACSSGRSGGHLGQIGKGQTLPPFEAALAMLSEGEISKEPVATEVGYHVIHLGRKVEGREMPYEAVRDWIANFLKDKSYHQAVRQYIQVLAGQAAIIGIKITQSDSPLVQ